MSTGSAYLTYIETEVVGGNTFHAFRVRIAKDPYWLVKYVLGLSEETLPLLLLDLVAEIPSVILEDAEIDKEAGGTFIAPSDLTYAFLTANTFHEAAKPTAPLEASVVIGQALFESCVAYYCEETPYPGMALPGDNDPEDYNPDENGWYYPPYADFDFAEKVVSQRSVSFQTAALEWLFSWVYNTCENDPDYHVMETLDEATFNFNGIYTWTAAQYVDTCNEGTGTGYLIEEGGAAGSEYISVWLFSPETDAARQYSPLIFGVSENPMSPIEIISSAGVLFSLLVSNPLAAFFPGKFAKLSAYHENKPLGASASPLGAATNQPLGGAVK